VGFEQRLEVVTCVRTIAGGRLVQEGNPHK
jgi:hypothetical protein